MEVEVRAWVPIRRFLRIFDDLPGDIESCLDNLVTSFASAFLSMEKDVVRASTCFAEPPGGVLQALSMGSDGLLSEQVARFIRLDIVKSVDAAAIRMQNGHLPYIEDEEIKLLAAHVMAPSVTDVMLLAQLAYPARVMSMEGSLWLGEKWISQIPGVVGFSPQILAVPPGAWPELKTLDLLKVVAWEQSLGLFAKDRSTSPIERAMASYTHSLAQGVTNGGESLFWLMQGLEAFYCRGNGDLRRQLGEKSRIFLGEWEDRKNIVGKLYDFRSKFVHGSFGLERWNSRGAGWDEYFHDQLELEAAGTMAARMLTATLQRCIEIGASEVEFDYKLRTNAGA